MSSRLGISLLSAILLLSSTFIGCSKLQSNKLAQEAQASCGFIQNSLGERISWKNSLPIKISVASSWPEEFLDTAQSAAVRWNDAIGFQIIEIIKNSADIRPESAIDLRNGLYWLSEWPSDKSLVQGVTRLFYSGNRAADADIKINSKNFEYFIDKPEGLYQVHMESLLIHEMGHLLGLKHYQNPPSVMDPILQYNYKRTEITVADQESLRCEYLK